MKTKAWMMALVGSTLLTACAKPDAYQTSIPTPGATAPSPASARAVNPRADFLRLIDRPRVAANVQVKPATMTAGYSQMAFTYDAEQGQTVPGILVKPPAATGKLPVVIYLHGTGGKKEDGLAVMRAAAAQGIIGVSIDGRYHGARAAAFPKEGAMNAYETAIYHTWRDNVPSGGINGPATTGEHPMRPLYYDTVWDVMRLIDYLQTRDDVDAAHIGIYGVSKGGIEAYLAAAVDPRITAAVPCIAVESFQWAEENNAWKPRVETFQKAFDAAARDSGVAAPDQKFVQAFYDRVMPGIDGEFDGPSMVPLIAPRALMAINGEKDPRTQPAALKLATDATKAAYKAAGAEDHFVLMIQPNTPHQVKPQAQAAGVAFLVKWLKP